MYCLYLAFGLLLTVANSDKVEAALEIITYEPLEMKLTFSKALPLPHFQLLFNQIPINFTVENQASSKEFIIAGNYEGIVEVGDYLTEKYVIMFTQPLEIDEGNLSLDSFLVRAKKSKNATEYILNPTIDKSSYYKFQNHDETLNTLAKVICILTYFLAYTTLIGIHAYNFVAIYVYISLKTSLFTSLDYKIDQYLLFDINEIEGNIRNEVIYLFIPYMCMGFALTVSLLSRLFLKKLANTSGLCNSLYYYLSYKFFIITWEIMCIPLFANTAHILFEAIQPLYHQSHVVNFVYVYFNIVVIGFYLYMTYFTTNPQLGESDLKWKSYTATSHFQLFGGFHLGIDPTSKCKRNYQFIYACIKILIMVFVTAMPTQIPNIFLQLAYFIYLFTVRPFRYNFFNNFYIAIQILIISFYMYRYIVELYIGISDEIATSTDMARILLTNIIFVCLIVLTYLILGAYQFYQRVRVFKINMNAWKRSSKYGDHEIRRTKRSAFEKEIQEEKQKKEESKNSQNERKNMDERNTKKGDEDSKSAIKPGKRGKEKSSLLQTISMGIEVHD